MGMAELFPSLRPKALRLMGFCEGDFRLPVNVGHLPTDNFIRLNRRIFRERSTLATCKTANSVSVTLLPRDRSRYTFFFHPTVSKLFSKIKFVARCFGGFSGRDRSI